MRVARKYERGLRGLAVLDGSDGQVLSVLHWPLTKGQARRAWRGSPHYKDACDCLIHFDKVRAGGQHNARRVRYDGRNYYVRYGTLADGTPRKVWIDGPLLADVLRVVTCVYGVRGRKDDRDENSA